MSLFMSLLLIINCKASIQEDRALMLLHAKDTKQLKMKINSFNETKRLEAQCNFELSKTLVPKSCYKLKLSTEKTQVMDKACERASLFIKEEVATDNLSKVCAEVISKKNKDIRYSKEEVSPEKYILGHNNHF